MSDKNKVDMVALLQQAAKRLDDPDTATTDALLSEFFVGLESVIGDMVVSKGTGPFTKARLVSMNDVLDTVAKMSEADLASWLNVSSPTKDKTYDGSKDQAFAAKQHPENPSKSLAAGKPATQDPTDKWNPTVAGNVPGSSRPNSAVSKSIGDFLDSMSGATPDEIEKARTGLSQLEPGVVATLEKVIEAGRVNSQIDEETEGVLNRGELTSERELRKSIIINSASLLERVAKMRGDVRGQQLELTVDPDDTFESDARMGRAIR